MLAILEPIWLIGARADVRDGAWPFGRHVPPLVNLLMTTGMHLDRTIEMKVEWYRNESENRRQDYRNASSSRLIVGSRDESMMQTTGMNPLLITSECMQRVRISTRSLCGTPYYGRGSYFSGFRNKHTQSTRPAYKRT